MKLTHLSLTLLLASLSLNTFAQHAGSVFVDANRNGIKDKGEQTLANVAVSDGLNVVRTDKNGNFTLAGHQKERFLHITTPSGFGTDNSYYKPIAKETASYDFGVYPLNGVVDKNGNHKFIHISDTEIGGTEGNHDWVQNLRDYSANEKVSFVILTGDICYENGLKSHVELMNSRNMGVQTYYTIGNHDLVKGEYGEQLFESLYGPSWYSFDMGGVHYIVTPMLGGDYRPSYTREDVFRWLENDLKANEGKPIMVFNHDLWSWGEEFKFKLSDNEVIDFDAHNLKAWLYGHWHVNHIQKHKSAYSICTSTPVRGGIDHSTSAFRVMSIDGKGDFTSELRYSYIDKLLEIASVSGNGIAQLPNGDVNVVVNAYSTVSPTVAVGYQLFLQGKEIGKAGRLTQNTDLGWSGGVAIPETLKNQMLTLKVQAEFANGEKAIQEKSFCYNTASAKAYPTTPWENMLQTPQHVAVSTDTLAAPLTLRWVANVGGNIYMTSPVVSDGRVFTATLDDHNNGECAVVSLDGATGRELWRFTTKESIKNSIAVCDGVVLAQDIAGNLYAIDATSGKLRWEKDLKTPLLPTLIEGLVAADGVVYAGTGKALQAVNVKTGETLWKNTGWNENQGSTATISLGKNNTLIGSTHWGALHANDAKTGETLWQHSRDGLRFRSGSAAMVDDILYIISEKSIFAIESRTGRIISKRDLKKGLDVTSTPLVTNSEIIFGTANDGVMAVDLETFEPKWTYRTNPAIIYTSPYVRNPSATVEASPVLSGDLVYVPASDGTLYALDRKTGRLMWQHATGSPMLTSVALSGNVLYVVDWSGNVYCFTSKI